MGLGQYKSLGEYCDPHTASIVFRLSVEIILSHLLIMGQERQKLKVGCSFFLFRYLSLCLLDFFELVEAICLFDRKTAVLV